MTPITVTANDFAKTYDALAYSGGNGVVYSVTPNGNLLGAVSFAGSSQGAKGAGSYVITPGGLYSNQQGYIISYGNGTLIVNPFPLDVTGVTASDKVYDSTLTATLGGPAAVAPFAGPLRLGVMVGAVGIGEEAEGGR